MKILHHRYAHIRQQQQGIEAVSLMVSIVVAVMVIAVIYVLIPDVTTIDRIAYEVTPISNVDYTKEENIIFQVSASQSGKVRLNITVYDSDNKGAVSASIEVTGPGFAKKVNTTDKFGKTQFVITFNLPSSGGEFITIKASGGDSGLGGSKTSQIPVQPK